MKNETRGYQKINNFGKAGDRRKFLEKLLRLSLESIGKVFVDKESQVHCENLLGGVSIPLGVAGPLKINGQYIRGEFYIPLATTEGVLVASVSRGAKAISMAGGAVVRLESVGATRGAVFQTSGIDDSLKFKKWLESNLTSLKEIVKKTSSHIKLEKMTFAVSGDRLFVRFYYDTTDAMGMNMATIATDKIVELVEKKMKIKCTALAGNFDIDKKPAWLNFISGRGKRAWAEVVLEKNIVENILKTSPKKIFEVWLAKCMIGSAMSGAIGFNAHFANIVAAFFAATGQDLAHVVEGSLGLTTTKILENGALYASIYLPALMIGTVGGGTGLKTQVQARSIIGVTKSTELAEALAGAVLAGEISLLASLAEGSLAKVHKSLGR